MKAIHRFTAAILLTVGMVGGIAAQVPAKPWTEWSEYEVRKVLDDSPWAKSQSRGEAVERHSAPLTAYDLRGADLQSLSSIITAKLYARFLSAQPTRQAFARLVELKQKSADPELRKQLQSFVDRKFDDWIVISVDYETSGKDTGPLRQTFANVNLQTLKRYTYLETKNGRLELQNYLPPNEDGLGAKFIFPRTLNGKPFITEDLKEVRFYSEIAKFLSLNVRFKVSEMMRDGKLEY